MLELNIVLEKQSDSPLYCQLYRHIREEIKSGQIPRNTRLPSIRSLSENLDVSKNTVESAYQQLMDEGYVESRPRSGLYVVELEKNFNSEKPVPAQYLKVNSKIEYKYDFDPNSADLDYFPFATWRKIVNEYLNPEYGDLYKYDDSSGNEKLKKQISLYLHHSRGVYCNEEQIVIGSTIQYLISILCQLIGLKKCIVAIEDPGCIEMKTIFKNLGFDVVGIPVEKDGINIDMLKASGAKIVYITPSKQFPSGMVMPIHKRVNILKWAEDVNGIILEGDYDGEYRYHGKPIPALQGLSNSENVIYLSTFSKYLLPSICMSYMVLPQKLLEICNQDHYIYEQSVSRLNQKVLEQFMDRGFWERHIRKMRNLYSKKYSILINALYEHMDDCLTIVGKDAGLHILVEVKNGMNEEELINAAANLGVKVYSYSAYLYNLDNYIHPRIILGFGGLSENSIVPAVKLLSKAWLGKSK